jgi:hypothetical protein
LTQNDVLKLERHVKKAARFVERQWPGIIDADDAEQEIYARLLETPGSVEKILDMDHDGQYRAIAWIANQIASKERNDYAHYKGAYRYSVKEVKDLLRAGGLSRDNTPGVKAEIIDLHEAFRALQDRNDSYAQAITKRYLLCQTPQTKEGQNNLLRGVEALTNEMNRSNRINRHSQGIK